MEYDIRDSEAQEVARQEAIKEKLLKREHEDALHKVLLSPEGKKLLQHWIDNFVMGRIADANDTQIGVGIKQGQANFVLDIKARLERLEKGE